MRDGMLAIVLAVMFTPSLAVATDPAIVYQVQPLGRLLDDARVILKSVGGDEAVKVFNSEMKSTFGEKGFEGIDINRPIIGYVDVSDNPKGSVAVICFPITGQKEWLDFCERSSKTKPKALKDGLFEITQGPLTAKMRVSEGYAYIAMGENTAHVLDAKTLVPFGKIYDGTDASLMSGRIYFDRLPKELRTKTKEVLKQFGNELQQFGTPGEKMFIDPFLGLATRVIDLSEGAKSATIRINLDTLTGEMVTELAVTALNGTPLDKWIAGMKPGTNRFAGMIGADAAAGIKIRLPLEVPEVQKATLAALDIFKERAKNDELVQELVKGLVRTVKSGELEGAAVLRGPLKDGTFVAVAAIVFDDPSGFEKELKKFIDGSAPPYIKDALKWDVEKVNGVGVHTLDLAKTPIAVFKAFGQNATLAFAFAPKGVYAAIGPGGEAVGAVKSAMSSKSAEAPMLELVYNGDKMVKLFGSVEPQNVPALEKMFGKQDKLLPAFSLSVTGGKELKVTLVFNERLLVSRLSHTSQLELRK